MTAKDRSEITANDFSAQPRGWMNRTVAGAGITGALGDFCYETTTVILPGFLAVLGIPAAALGLIKGIADAVASFTKMASGYVADKLGHRKLLVLVGYGLTSLGQALTAPAFWWEVDRVALLAGIFFIAGLYVAVQEALESTVSANMVPTETMIMSIGALGTINGVAKFLSTASIGVVWTAVSPVLAFALTAGFMLAGTFALPRVRA
ncbi:MAG: hypothetical protein HO274_02185 [Ferrovum myxofaciens]|uniref:hypothetical protein n=1 Tax=Ferrovum myxofaciens TaxID=416213 RepID=UPI002356EC03|nr:hypothetical protein [Ferrovum myxofaciens]QKE40271.1 MAG: hypothetical protein HO274_02185 [Ferrovum myxofaciens]